MTDNITYKFCIESLRYVYRIIGYDNALKELNFIKHIDSPINTTLPQEPFIEKTNEIIICGTGRFRT